MSLNKSEKTINLSINKPARKSFAGLSIYYKSTNDFQELNNNFTDISSENIYGDNINSTSIGIKTGDLRHSKTISIIYKFDINLLKIKIQPTLSER